MKKAGLLAVVLGFALMLPGCGFTEGTDAVVTVVEATPTPTPEPTPEVVETPTPEPTPVPEVVTEQTPSGMNVTVGNATYTANSDINLRADASADAEFVAGVAAGTVLNSTGVCENGWIRVDYEGQVVYASGDYVTPADAAPAEAAPAEEAPAEGEALTDGTEG